MRELVINFAGETVYKQFTEIYRIQRMGFWHACPGANR